MSKLPNRRILFALGVALAVAGLALWLPGRDSQESPVVRHLATALLPPGERSCVLRSERLDAYAGFLPLDDEVAPLGAPKQPSWCTTHGPDATRGVAALDVEEGIVVEYKGFVGVCRYSQKRRYRFHLGGGWSGECRNDLNQIIRPTFLG